jgi:hypothetical protein
MALHMLFVIKTEKSSKFAAGKSPKGLTSAPIAPACITFTATSSIPVAFCFLNGLLKPDVFWFAGVLLDSSMTAFLGCFPPLFPPCNVLQFPHHLLVMRSSPKHFGHVQWVSGGRRDG